MSTGRGARLFPDARFSLQQLLTHLEGLLDAQPTDLLPIPGEPVQAAHGVPTEGHRDPYGPDLGSIMRLRPGDPCGADAHRRDPERRG